MKRFAKWLQSWKERRAAKREAERRLNVLAARARMMENIVQTSDEESPTGIFNTVKSTIDKATDEKRKARDSAQRILKTPPPEGKK